MTHAVTFQTIIERWPARKALAADLGVQLSAVHHWHHRNSIPAKYDLQLLSVAKRRGVQLSVYELATARARPCLLPGVPVSRVS